MSTRPTRRAMIAGTAAVAGMAACDHQAARAVMGTRTLRSLSAFGIEPATPRDQWSALGKAFAAAHAEGFDLVAEPGASYRHDGPLLLDGVSLDGRGATLLALSDGPQVLHCVGAGWRLANLRVLCAAHARTTDDQANGVMVGAEGGHPATDFVLENVTVDAVAPGRGAGATGFMFNSASRGHIIRPVVRHSWADGIHVTNGSHDLLFERPLSEWTGDDGFAVVSYRRHGVLCRSIRVIDGISRDSGSRGCSVVGGRDVVYQRFTAERSARAGVYLYGEDAFDTYGVSRCRLMAPVLRDCVTGHGTPPGFAQAALIIGGRDGADVVDGITLARGAADCLVTNPVVAGVGAACWAGISTHEYAIRPRITGARLSNLIAPTGGYRPNGVEVGGRDVVIDDARMRNVAGLAVVVTPTASGDCVVSRPQVTGSLLRPGPIASYIYADLATKVHEVTVSDGHFAGGPGRLAIDRLSSGTLRLVRNKVT